MGQDQSLVDESVATETLQARTIAAVAEHIKSGHVRRITVMTGAGISTAAGIPDFRSPDTGLYANLARLNLPYAEAVFDIGYFGQNPEPFYMLARELYPGKYHPTVSHVFIALLADKGLLHHLFTQNIDCLERRAGVPGDLITEAHGSFATQRCIECATPFPDDRMREHVAAGQVPRCVARGCNGLVKPDIVFFGEALPQQFRDRQHLPAMADLALVMGTSLSVQPFSSLPGIVRPKVPRVLFNMERVGDLGYRPDDVLVLGDCDAGIRQLADALGWRDELEAKWREVVGEKEAERQLSTAKTHTSVGQDELDELVERVGGALHIDDDETPSAENPESAAAGSAAEKRDGTRDELATAPKDDTVAATTGESAKTSPEDKSTDATAAATPEVMRTTIMVEQTQAKDHPQVAEEPKQPDSGVKEETEAPREVVAGNPPAIKPAL